MTARAKKSPDIHTDRFKPELPILDRALPAEPIITGRPTEVQAPPAVPSSDEGHGDAVDVNRAERTLAWPDDPYGGVSINSEPLTYEPQSTTRSWPRRILGGLLPGAVLVGAAVTAGAAMTVAASPQAAAVTGSPSAEQESLPPGLTVKSARFDLDGPQGATTAGYRSLVVVDDGFEIRLSPMAGSVRVTMAQSDASAVTAFVDGAPVDPSGGDGNDIGAVANAISSLSVAGFVDVGPSVDGGAHAINLYFDRPLTSDDFLAITEGGGDGRVELSAINDGGAPTGDVAIIAPPYQLNTGHTLVGSAPGAAAWASVLPVAEFGRGAEPVAGIQVRTADAQVKVLALVQDEATSSGLTPAEHGQDVGANGDQHEGDDGGPDDGTTANAVSDSDGTVYASVGLDAKIQPALAVDGAGCLSAPAGSVSVAQAVTFCYLVTNRGTTNLTDIRISDAKLGLVDATLPVASGPTILQPGQQAVFYHHAVAGQRSLDDESIVTAQPVDEAGDPLTELIAPTGVGFPGAIGTTATPASATGGPTQPVDPVTDVGAAGNGATDGDANSTGQNPMANSSGQGLTTSGRTDVPAGANDAVAADLVAGGLVSDDAVMAAAQAPSELAMTGIRTEPWIMVILAMGLIFVGYTAVAGFTVTRSSDRNSGHEQLDLLGFD